MPITSDCRGKDVSSSACTSSSNTHTSLRILDLPHDILCEVFYTCAKIYASTPHHLGWICLSHVCRLWREVLLDLPNLWAHVVCLYPDALEQILSRARNVPITLDYGTLGSRRDAERFVELLPRARSVLDREKRVWHRHYCHWEALLPGMRLPKLMDLDIAGVPHLGRIRLHPEERLVAKNSANTEIPALLRLHLRGISLSIHAPRLRSLSIEHHHSGIDTTWTIPELLSMLSRYPLLEHLTLLYAIQPTRNDETQLADALQELSVGPDHRIDFPHLTSLHVGGHPQDLTTLWRSLLIPRSAFVRFEFTLPSVQPGILITRLLEAVKEQLDDPLNNTVTLRGRASQRNWIEGIIGPTTGMSTPPVKGTCIFNISLHVPSMLAELALAYTLSAFVLAAIPHARTLRLVDYALGSEPLNFGSSSIHALYVQGSEAHETVANVLRNGSLPELRSVDIVNVGDAPGHGAEIAEVLQLRTPPLGQLVLRGPARYLDYREREEELELLQDVVDELIDLREWDVEDEGNSGKARKLAGLGVALLLSSVTLLQT